MKKTYITPEFLIMEDTELSAILSSDSVVLDMKKGTSSVGYLGNGGGQSTGSADSKGSTFSLWVNDDL